MMCISLNSWNRGATNLLYFISAPGVPYLLAKQLQFYFDWLNAIFVLIRIVYQGSNVSMVFI